jgi:hypothetical protein
VARENRSLGIERDRDGESEYSRAYVILDMEAAPAYGKKRVSFWW